MRFFSHISGSFHKLITIIPFIPHFHMDSNYFPQYFGIFPKFFVLTAINGLYLVVSVVSAIDVVFNLVVISFNISHRVATITFFRNFFANSK